jgi:tetratricopeptide (TPR) repeat protein
LTQLGALQVALGDCKQAQANAAAGLAIFRSRISLPTAAMVSAFCSEPSRTQALIDEMMKLYPRDTVVNSIALPSIRAQLQRSRGNFDEALRLLESVRRFDMGNIVGFRNNYLRAVCYLDQKNGVEAEKEFQKIIDNRTRDLISPLYTLAHLGVARSAALNGDKAKSRKAYQDFFVLWKDADSDSPIMAKAKKEYEALKD